MSESGVRNVIISKIDLPSSVKEDFKVNNIYIFYYRKNKNININKINYNENKKISPVIDLLNLYLKTNKTSTFNIDYKNKIYNCNKTNSYNYEITQKDSNKIIELNIDNIIDFNTNLNILQNKKYPVNNPYPDKSYYNSVARSKFDKIVQKYFDKLKEENKGPNPNENDNQTNQTNTENDNKDNKDNIELSVPISSFDPFGSSTNESETTGQNNNDNKVIPDKPITPNGNDTIADNDNLGNGNRVGLHPSILDELAKIVGIGVVGMVTIGIIFTVIGFEPAIVVAVGAIGLVTENNAGASTITSPSNNFSSENGIVKENIGRPEGERIEKPVITTEPTGEVKCYAVIDITIGSDGKSVDNVNYNTGEQFCGVFDSQGNLVQEISPPQIDKNTGDTGDTTPSSSDNKTEPEKPDEPEKPETPDGTNGGGTQGYSNPEGDDYNDGTSLGPSKKNSNNSNNGNGAGMSRDEYKNWLKRFMKPRFPEPDDYYREMVDTVYTVQSFSITKLNKKNTINKNIMKQEKAFQLFKLFVNTELISEFISRGNNFDYTFINNLVINIKQLDINNMENNMELLNYNGVNYNGIKKIKNNNITNTFSKTSFIYGILAGLIIEYLFSTYVV